MSMEARNNMQIFFFLLINVAKSRMVIFNFFHLQNNDQKLFFLWRWDGFEPLHFTDLVVFTISKNRLDDQSHILLILVLLTLFSSPKRSTMPNL